MSDIPKTERVETMDSLAKNPDMRAAHTLKSESPIGKSNGDKSFARQASILSSADAAIENDGVREESMYIALAQRNTMLPARERNSFIFSAIIRRRFERRGALYFGSSMESGGAF